MGLLYTVSNSLHSSKMPPPPQKKPSALCLFWAPLPYTYMYVIITPESQKKIIQQKILPKNPRFFIYICHAMTNIKKYYQLLAFLPYYTTTFLPMAFLVIADAIKYIFYYKWVKEFLTHGYKISKILSL